MIMLIDSVGQEFREGTAGKVCLCLMMSGASTGMVWGSDSWGQNHLLHYVWHLDWAQLGSQQLHVTSSCDLSFSQPESQEGTH